MTVKRHRIVIDTNVFVSAALRTGSVSDRAVIEAVATGTVLISKDSLEEIEAVLQRPKFNKTNIPELRAAFLAQYLDRFETVVCTDTVTDCRDPKDNKFLELALGGKADFLITGDADLLALHPWRGIGILSPAEFLALSE